MITEKNNKKDKDEHPIVVGDVIWLCMAAIVCMFIVWITLEVPVKSERQANRFCYFHCVSEVEKEKGKMKITSGPSYITDLKKCYKECMKEEDAKK